MRTSRSDSNDALNARLYRETGRQVRQLGGAGWAAFQIADAFQQEAVDTAFDALALRPSAVGRVASAINDQLWEGATLVPAGDSPRHPLGEIQASYRVFTLVSDVRRALDLPPGPFPLLAALDRARDRLGFEALWAVEGLGHEFAAARWRRDGEAMTAMLRDRRIPRRYQHMLHAGMGLFFAELLHASVTPFSDADEIDSAVADFSDRCTRNAVSGVTGPAFESLGLVTRTWYPTMLPSLVRALPGELRSFFWHGAGRALYFLPVHAVPGIRSAWLSAEREARDPVSGLNLRAGLAWATTLVNVRTPGLLESVVRLRGDFLSRDGAFVYGVRTAIAMASDASPGDPALEAFVDYEPRDRAIGDPWDDLVRRPASEGIRLGLRNSRSVKPFLGRAFRYQFPWDEAWA